MYSFTPYSKNLLNFSYILFDSSSEYP